MENAVSTKSEAAWLRLLQFPLIALSLPAREKASDINVSLTTKIKRQITQYMDGTDTQTYAQLEDRPGGHTSSSRRRRQPSEGEELKKRVGAKLSDGDVKGALRLLTSSNTIALPSDENIACLKTKHPDAPVDLDLPPGPDRELEPPAQVSEADITAAICGFNTGSSAGLDGLRPAHLKDLIGRSAGEAGVRLVTALTALVNQAIRGELPAAARPAFFGATLTALRKSDGGLRPIAVGCVYRRLATKVVLRSLTADLGHQLRPVQLGFGTAGGCEAVVHSSRRFMETMESGDVMVKIDMKNAFNTIRRDTFLRVVRERAPGLYPLLWQAYSEPTPLYYGTVKMQSATGLQQGDPCGPAVFSLAIDSAVREINAKFNAWYLDDGSIGGDIDTVCNDLQQIIPALSARGLVVNPTKCEIILSKSCDQHHQRTISERLHRHLQGAVIVAESQARMLGAPMTDTAAKHVMAEKKADLVRMVDRLQHIDAHSAFYLLQNCLWLPKLQYILRAFPIYRQLDLLQPLDATLRAAISKITNVAFSQNSWTQAVLPVRYGGLGLRRTEDLALPSYVSSLHHCFDLVMTLLPASLHTDMHAERENTVADWKNVAEPAEPPAGDAARRQRHWDSVLAVKARTHLLSAANQLDQARLLAAGTSESGAWLHALPSASLGTLLDPPTLRVAVALRVGAEVCQPHRCRCGSPTDSLGYHALTCRLSAGRYPRHTALNEVVRRALQAVGVPSLLEPTGIDRGDGKRPDGLTLFPFSEGKSLVWDATCVNTFAPSHLPATAAVAGAAARDAEERKVRKYAGLAGQFEVQPVAFETSGACGPATSRFIRQLGCRLVGMTGDARESSWLRQRFALAVVRGNAASVLHTIEASAATPLPLQPERQPPPRPEASPLNRRDTSTLPQAETPPPPRPEMPDQPSPLPPMSDSPPPPQLLNPPPSPPPQMPDPPTPPQPLDTPRSQPPLRPNSEAGRQGPPHLRSEATALLDRVIQCGLTLAPQEFDIPWGEIFGARPAVAESANSGTRGAVACHPRQSSPPRAQESEQLQRPSEPTSSDTSLTWPCRDSEPPVVNQSAEEQPGNGASASHVDNESGSLASRSPHPRRASAADRLTEYRIIYREMCREENANNRDMLADPDLARYFTR